MAAATVAAALGVILAKSPVASVLSLLVSFFGLATIYLLAGFQFIAAAQILVYAGAIMVLFLFVIMLLNLADLPSMQKIDVAAFRGGRAALMIAVAAALFLASAVAIDSHGRARETGTMPEHGYDEVARLAEGMFTRYLVPFEAVSLLLLATVVAVIVLAKRERTPRVRVDSSRREAAGHRAPEPERVRP